MPYKISNASRRILNTHYIAYILLSMDLRIGHKCMTANLRFYSEPYNRVLGQSQKSFSLVDTKTDSVAFYQICLDCFSKIEYYPSYTHHASTVKVVA